MENTTALARKYGMTTKGIRTKLDSLGIKPEKQIIMSSGRTFALWDENKVNDALTVNNDQPEPIGENQTQENKPQNQSDELRDIKILLTQILDYLTKQNSSSN